MDLKVSVSLPYLWNNETFVKDKWGSINFLVGPNGTGKTLFAEALRNQCTGSGLKARYLNAERLFGYEKQSYGSGFGYSQMEQGFNTGNFESYKTTGSTYGLSSDAFILLKERLDLRILVEASLSQLFQRQLKFVEQGGYLKIKVQRGNGIEYDLKQNESNGLKEIITLLTFLYHPDYNCLILDEPELHLHPQFQTFLLQEMRKIAGNPIKEPGKKCFFLITHSPYFVDVRTIEELRDCIVFQPNKLPAFVAELDVDDEYRIKQLLPRLNTHHKQFFFASRPIFVEGYTDQQLFTLIQEKRGRLLGASGSGIVDVGGKDDLDIFFRICKRLNKDAQFITDFDSIFQGKLRQSVSQDDRCKEYLQKEGLGTELMKIIGDLEKDIDSCISELETYFAKTTVADEALTLLKEELELINQNGDKDKLAKKRYVLSVACAIIQEKLLAVFSTNPNRLKTIEGRIERVIGAFRKSNVFVLRKGELENYLPGYTDSPYSIADNTKTRYFQEERDSILKNDTKWVEEHYPQLIAILDQASSSTAVDLTTHLTFVIQDWIYKVQSSFVRNRIRDMDGLKRDLNVDWSSHSRIFELIEFTPDNNGFNCKIKLKPTVDLHSRECIFFRNTPPAEYRIPDIPKDKEKS